MKKVLQTVLVVLDGWGHRSETSDNAIASAETPFFSRLWRTYPHSLLSASEEGVGLPHGQMGNSEVGHMTIGAGTVIMSDLLRITKAIRNNELSQNTALIKLFEHVRLHGSTLHVMGLMSPGGVHSHQEHLFAFLKEAKNAGITRIAIHVFTDGRDTSPQSAVHYLEELQMLLAELGVGHIATASGRFYAMDRDNNWDRVSKAGKAIFACEGIQCGTQKPSEAIQALYAKGVVDEHLEPLVFLDETGKSYPVEKNDGVFFFNFRADRARMLAKQVMERAEKDTIRFVTLTEYDPCLTCDVAFPAQKIEHTLAGELSAAGLTQVHIAETEKYAHATYFLNGGKEAPYPNERHILVESRKDVKTHDLAPRMRAEEIANVALREIEAGTDFIFINFANADMVGHTANVPALIEALEELDRQLARVGEAIIAKGGALFVTADHGNAELNKDPASGVAHTAHTTNLVPFIAVVPGKTDVLQDGTLADIAPTVLPVMGLPTPASMTGKNLFGK